MKYIAILLFPLVLTACGTLGGAVSGLGDDLKSAGEMIKPSKKGQ